MKKAFTIIELMAVVAIMGILMGIVVSAAANSIRLSRSEKTKAICATVRQGLETYHAQYNKWPEPVGDGSGMTPKTTSKATDWERAELEPAQVRRVVREIVDESVNNANPMMDVSGLYVSRDPGEKNGRGNGYDFWEAVRGSERTRKKMSLAEMYFGYPDVNSGFFRRFKMVYVIPTDVLEVSTQ